MVKFTKVSCCHVLLPHAHVFLMQSCWSICSKIISTETYYSDVLLPHADAAADVERKIESTKLQGKLNKSTVK